jgi:ABC-type phosphate/phosphonate transport system substrate-binding protein
MTRRVQLLLASILLSAATVAHAAELRLAVVQAQSGDARRYQALLDYLETRGIRSVMVTPKDYAAAAEMFAAGSADAMFGGSGIAGTMMIKGVGDVMVRSVGANGVSGYRAVVIGTKGSPRFDGKGSYFDGKRVAYAALASAGELFFESLGKSSPAAKTRVPSHGAALEVVARGEADFAIVKNHVWTAEQGRYAGLELVGSDDGDNPDGSLIVSTKLAPERAKEIAAALVALEGDPSPAAAAARAVLKIRGYVRALPRDFAHTLGLLQRAGVTKDFAFKF